MVDDSKSDAEGAVPTPASNVRRVTSVELLQGSKELWIDHAGEIYRLRVTKRNKLILTK